MSTAKTNDPDGGEIYRQLVAAKEGRYRKLPSGRFAIDGEKAPEWRIRQRLQSHLWISVPQFEGPVTITSEGEVALPLVTPEPAGRRRKQ